MSSGEGRHVLTVSVEDFHHSGALEKAVLRKHWDRFESHLDRYVSNTLELLAAHGATATFFVLGCTAERQPSIVRRIVEAGHEVASRGYWPRGLLGMTPEEFKDDLARTRDALLRAGARRIVGYRASPWLGPDDLWVLDVLAEEGYLYDSSVNPVLRRFSARPEFYRVHDHRAREDGRVIREYPITTASVLGWRIAISGGNYLRQLPAWWLDRAIDRHVARRDDPLVFYFLPWELQRGLPRIRGLSRYDHLRLYRNAGRTRTLLERYLTRFRFVSIGEHLGAAPSAPEPAPARRDPGRSVEETLITGPASGPPRRVALVVPLFDEDDAVAYLRRTLESFRARVRRRYHVELVIVDDGSRDRTWNTLLAEFSTVPDVRLLRHDRNAGVAAAIATGLAATSCEIAASIDGDCSYDPLELPAMFDTLLESGADLVTASPYHPAGRVVNVPGWRLFLSRNLSRLYSAVLGRRFYTLTSCCRVYRRDRFAGMPRRYDGFLGVAETMVRACLAGYAIVEYPATLESRLLGRSKMRTLSTVIAHAGLLARAAWWRLRGQACPAARPAPRIADRHDAVEGPLAELAGEVGR